MSSFLRMPHKHQVLKLQQLALQRVLVAAGDYQKLREPVNVTMSDSHTHDKDKEVEEENPRITALKKKLRETTSWVWDEMDRDVIINLTNTMRRKLL